MQKGVRNRLLLIASCLFSIALGICLILHNLKQNIIFFYPPSKIHEIKDTNKNDIRVGGIIKPDSIVKVNVTQIKFVVTDNQHELEVHYQGMLPALFRENQGVVARGKLDKNIFIASELLTKHDENYMPPEVAKSLKAN